MQFDFEPVPLLRALSAGRIPEQPTVAGHFEIGLTADGPEGIDGIAAEEMLEAFPFH
jgi:hypothetical protein